MNVNGTDPSAIVSSDPICELNECPSKISYVYVAGSEVGIEAVTSTLPASLSQFASSVTMVAITGSS